LFQHLSSNSHGSQSKLKCLQAILLLFDNSRCQSCLLSLYFTLTLIVDHPPWLQQVCPSDCHHLAPTTNRQRWSFPTFPPSKMQISYLHSLANF
jgi:hypothetical protein